MKQTTLFVKYLGDSPKIRVLDVLLTGRELEYSITDIADSAEISRATFYAMLNDLIKNKIIMATRKFGNIQLYKLNTTHPFIKDLMKIYDKIILSEAKKEIERQSSHIVIKKW